MNKTIIIGLAIILLLTMTVNAELGVNWTQATATAPWAPRGDQASLVFDNKMWIIGGYDTNTYNNLNDVWYSTNGIDWTEATTSADWPIRDYPGVISFNGKLWLMGGLANGIDLLNDVWYSTDGVNWTFAGNASWSPRMNFGLISFNNKMWVIGGYYTDSDVWYSSDGINWTEATASAAWSGRRDLQAIVFNNKMWVIGGNDGLVKNDVWFSTDGITWNETTANADWSPRQDFGATVFNDKIWITGGTNAVNPSTEYNDVWYSTDGTTWTEMTDSAPWHARFNEATLPMLSYNNKLWILGGLYDFSNWYNLDDVWYSEGPEIIPPASLNIPTETSAASRGNYYYRDANGNIYTREQIEGTAGKAAPLAMIVPEGEPINNPFTSLWQTIKNFLHGIGVNI